MKAAFTHQECPNVTEKDAMLRAEGVLGGVFCPCGYLCFLKNRSLAGGAVYQCRRCGKQYPETEVETVAHDENHCPYCEARAADKGKEAGR